MVRRWHNKDIHSVIGYPTLDWPKTLRSDSKEEIKKNTGAKWNKRGMTIDTIQEPLVDFSIRVISHKFYQSNRLNNSGCWLQISQEGSYL